ncbi:MAG: hypothetical protein RI955_1445, partial [Bacteroidota bacterium]
QNSKGIPAMGTPLNCNGQMQVSPTVSTLYINYYANPIDTIYDSVWVFVNKSFNTINQTTCSGSGFLFNGNTLTVSGTYFDTLTNSVSCDSIITLNLIIGSPSSSAYSHSICSGNSYLFNGNNLTTAGIYKDTLVNASGCDSVITLTLTIKPISSSAFTHSICSGNSYLFNGNSLTTSGIYKDTLVNFVGCDSVISLTLTVNPIALNSISQSICSNQPYLFNGNNINISGIYKDTLTSYLGCDSILTLTLSVLPISSSSFSQSTCSTSPYYFNNKFLSVAGTYKDTLTNYLGCDSIITLNLSIIQSPTLTFKPLTQSCFISTNCVSLNITATGGALPYNISAIAKHGGVYNSSNKTMCWAAPTKDTITVIVTDNNGCSTSSSDTIYPATDCVWPGDANSDLVANQFDILPIGLGYGYVGPIRTLASLVWIDQPAMPFTNLMPANQPNAANWKHADCNGDGIIDGNDTVAILQNFGLTHLRQSVGNAKFDKALPTMQIVFTPDTLYNGMQLTASIELGNVTVHANNVYGFAFDYLYDALVTDTNSLSWSIPTSFMFTSPTDHISIGKNLKSQGVFKFGAIRNDHHPKSGYGTVLTITADILSGNIPGRINALKNYIYNAVIQNLVIVDSSGTQLIYNIVNDSSLLLYQPKGIDNINFEKQIKVYPNPADNFVKIITPLDGEKHIKVMNVIGQIIYSTSTFDNKININTENYQNGLYSILIQQNENLAVKKIIISR